MGKAEALFDLCEDQYVRKGKPFTSIKELFGVSMTTLTKWKKDGKWDQKRKAFLASPKTVLEMAEEVLRRKLEEVINILPERMDAGVIDGLTKLIKNVERLRKEYKLMDISVLVMDEFVSFTKGREKDAERRDVMFSMVNQFIDFVSND